MTPGKKSQPLSAISSIAWNRQVLYRDLSFFVLFIFCFWYYLVKENPVFIYQIGLQLDL